MESDSDSGSDMKLVSLISQIMSLGDTTDSDSDSASGPKSMLLIKQTISLVRSMDLDSQPKPESKLTSLVTQTVSFFNSMDLDSQPKPLMEIIPVITQLINSIDSEFDADLESKFDSLVDELLILEPEPELMSLIHQIFSLVVSMNPKWTKLVTSSPQVQVTMNERKFTVREEKVLGMSSNKWHCLPLFWKKFKLTHFYCQACNGKNHEEYEKAPLKIKHPLHPKHFLQLVSWKWKSRNRECYCCDEDLFVVFYYCSPCDYAMNIACVEKPQVLSIDHPKWHGHKLQLFPRNASLTCNLCALADLSSPIYMCPPCDFVVHLRCLSLPRVIKISRHLHRISFTHSFDQGGVWSCGVCRRKIDNDYGGYSCIKDDCPYAAHSRCATQSNVWDGEELENEPEEIEEEEVEPFVTISDGIIQHFCHDYEHHPLRLNENTGKDYDENKHCQACITPIYFGNFYSCMQQCGFVLHEACANLSRKIYNPIHPHLLTLENNDTSITNLLSCAACLLSCTGFFYKCGQEKCDFKVHVQCATISEPLVHESHKDPLFLTSKPEERRKCGVCKGDKAFKRYETFNCIECDFSLCFGCATLPYKVRYKHDKHMLTLSYGKETSTMTYWCEVCERKVNPTERFYRCDEYCCVTLHIDCLIGKDLYMNPGSSWLYRSKRVDVLPNHRHMTRPTCSKCKKRCPYKIVFQCFGLIYCSVDCLEMTRYM